MSLGGLDGARLGAVDADAQARRAVLGGEAADLHDWLDYLLGLGDADPLANDDAVAAEEHPRLGLAVVGCVEALASDLISEVVVDQVDSAQAPRRHAHQVDEHLPWLREPGRWLEEREPTLGGHLREGDGQVEHAAAAQRRPVARIRADERHGVHASTLAPVGIDGQRHGVAWLECEGWCGVPVAAVVLDVEPGLVDLPAARGELERAGAVVLVRDADVRQVAARRAVEAQRRHALGGLHADVRCALVLEPVQGPVTDRAADEAQRRQQLLGGLPLCRAAERVADGELAGDDHAAASLGEPQDALGSRLVHVVHTWQQQGANARHAIRGQVGRDDDLEGDAGVGEGLAECVDVLEMAVLEVGGGRVEDGDVAARLRLGVEGLVGAEEGVCLLDRAVDAAAEGVGGVGDWEGREEAVVGDVGATAGGRLGGGEGELLGYGRGRVEEVVHALVPSALAALGSDLRRQVGEHPGGLAVRGGQARLVAECVVDERRMRHGLVEDEIDRARLDRGETVAEAEVRRVEQRRVVLAAGFAQARVVAGQAVGREGAGRPGELVAVDRGHVVAWLEAAFGGPALPRRDRLGPVVVAGPEGVVEEDGGHVWAVPDPPCAPAHVFGPGGHVERAVAAHRVVVGQELGAVVAQHNGVLELRGFRDGVDGHGAAAHVGHVAEAARAGILGGLGAIEVAAVHEGLAAVEEEVHALAVGAAVVEAPVKPAPLRPGRHLGVLAPIGPAGRCQECGDKPHDQLAEHGGSLLATGFSSVWFEVQHLDVARAEAQRKRPARVEPPVGLIGHEAARRGDGAEA